METKQVDSFHFIGGISRRMLKTWIEMETPREIPWTPLPKPLSECRVALISSGGIALREDVPFDQEGERQNPWWGDPSYRVIPRTTRTEDIRVYHMHIDRRLGEKDVNCLLPLQRLDTLAAAGEVGSSAENHFSIMGYILQPEELLQVTVPQIVMQLKTDQVDAVVLFPT